MIHKHITPSNNTFHFL